MILAGMAGVRSRPTFVPEHLEVSFSNTKNRAFAAYDFVAEWLARQPAGLRRTAYAALGGVLWVPFLLPGNHVRTTFEGLARRAGVPSSTALFTAYVSRLMLGVERAERVRHGFGTEIDPLLRIPDERKLMDLLSHGGVFLALPHAHAALPMVRGLSQRYPVLAIVRLPSNERRAAAQRRLYEQVGCDFIDARHAPPMAVARQTVRALKAGWIVVGTVDRIAPAPPSEIDPATDLVRATAFGQPIGVGGWPSRFARASGAPILPAMVIQSDTGIQLMLGPAIAPDRDLVAVTQSWVTAMEDLILCHPSEWTFSLDKQWSRVLRSERPAGSSSL
jgi:lauroyl/myristoyl acyltransferase